MAKKNKKTKKKAKEKQRRIAKLTFDELLEKADQHILAKKFRDAIKMYKLAIKNSKSRKLVQMGHGKLFLAYMLKAKELTGKHMTVEAASLRKQAMACLPAPEFVDLDSIAFVIELCDMGKAFDYIQQYIARKGTDPRIGVLLADRLVTQGGWDFWVKKDLSFFISRDAPVVQKCLGLMDKGQWQQAVDGMKTLPRSSAFSHIRMFCKAMALFGQGDDKNMYKAISMIPDVSVFAEIAAVLGQTVQAVQERAPIKENKTIAACFWKGGLDAWDTAEKIIEKEAKNSFDKTMGQLILTFSKQLLPQNPEYAAQYLLETLWQGNMTGEKAFIALEKSLLPRRAKLLQAKRKILFMDRLLDNAAKYLDLLKKTEPDPQILTMVESAILSYVCRVTVWGGNQDELINLTDQTATRFGLARNVKMDSLWMQCAARGLQCDAGNRELYELVIRMNVMSRDAKKIKEKLLLAMCEAFPDDPYPCIELASVYHDKNAFRKAEAILKKAMELAPYDNRVQEMHSISLVISADRSVGKCNYQRARQDLEKAVALDMGTNTLLLQEKELFYQICEQPKMSEKTIGVYLDQFPLFQRLKLVSMLRMDAEKKPRKNYARVFNKIDAVFKKELGQIRRLTSEELLSLLSPFPREWQHLFAYLEVHLLILETDDKVVKLLNSDDLIRFMDRSLSPDYFTLFQSELDRRLRTGKKDANRELLTFYALALEGIGDDLWDVDRLMDLVEDADSEMKKAFKAAGERLSRYTHGPCRHALQTLEFEILDDLLDDPFYDYDDDYDDDQAFDPFGFLPEDIVDLGLLEDPFLKKMFKDHAKKMKRENPRVYQETFNQLTHTLEEIIDESGLRGAPVPVLKKFKKDIIADNYEISEMVLMVNLFFGDEVKKKLSREVKTVFLD